MCENDLIYILLDVKTTEWNQNQHFIAVFIQSTEETRFPDRFLLKEVRKKR